MRWMMVLMATMLTTMAQAQTLHLQSGKRPVQMVELFTSEGCSSCPPAEAFLNTYVKDPGLWQRVIPLAFHVDYWDYLGWRDRYDSPGNSRRQRDYARSLGMPSVYTPALFVNGRPWRGWRRDELPAGGQELAAGSLRVEMNDRHVQAFYDPKTTASQWQLHVAVLGMGLVTRIRAGENRGRTARHEFVVLGHTTLAGGDGHWQGALPKASLKATRYAVVVWVSGGGSPRPLQAVGAYLPQAVFK